MDNHPQVMTAAQLAKFLSVSRPTAYEIMRTHLKDVAIKLSDSERGNVRVLKEDVLRWLEQRKQGA